MYYFYIIGNIKNIATKNINYMLCTCHNFDRTISLHHDGRSKFSLTLNISSLICSYTCIQDRFR